MTIPWQPGPQGNMVVPAGYTEPHSWSPYSALQLVASTAVGGFALQNGTPTILSWAVPVDGFLHQVLVVSMIHVTVNETGGQVTVTHTAPDSSAFSPVLFAAGLTAGVNYTTFGVFAKAGTVVSVQQGNALTAGASLLWTELWAS